MSYKNATEEKPLDTRADVADTSIKSKMLLEDFVPRFESKWWGEILVEVQDGWPHMALITERKKKYARRA